MCGDIWVKIFAARRKWWLGKLAGVISLLFLKLAKGESEPMCEPLFSLDVSISYLPCNCLTWKPNIKVIILALAINRLRFTPEIDQARGINGYCLKPTF